MRRLGLCAAAALAIWAAGCATSHKTARNPASAAPQSAAPGLPAAAAPAHVDPGSTLVERALSMVGQPYRYGGAAPGGFDCSGLAVYAAAGAGISLPRTTREQLRVGIAVPPGSIEPADLVFLRLAHKELHVGIAIDGTRFVHAPSAGGTVRIDSLALAPYSSGFLAARRIVDPTSAAASRSPPQGPAP